MGITRTTSATRSLRAAGDAGTITASSRWCGPFSSRFSSAFEYTIPRSDQVTTHSGAVAASRSRIRVSATDGSTGFFAVPLKAAPETRRTRRLRVRAT